MSNILYADPDAEVSAMCHKNHVDRAFIYEQEIPDTEYEPVQAEAKSGPVIRIFERKMQVNKDRTLGTTGPSRRIVGKILGALARGGVGLAFLCGVADGLIDTTYGLMLTICCIGWGLLHLLQGVAHG